MCEQCSLISGPEIEKTKKNKKSFIATDSDDIVVFFFGLCWSYCSNDVITITLHVQFNTRILN